MFLIMISFYLAYDSSKECKEYDTCNELKPTQVFSPHVELKPLIIATPPQQKPSGLDPRAFSMYPTAEDLSKPDEPQDNNTRERRHQFRHIGGAETSTLSNSINSDKLYQQNVENTKEKLKDLTISESSTIPEASTATNNSTDISNPSKSDRKLIELKDARLKLIKNFAETKQLSFLSELLQLNDRITFIQGFDDIQIISSPSSSPSPSTEAKPCSSTDRCYKQAVTELPTSAAIIGNINDMNARYAYEQKILITGIEPHECPYTKILRRKTAAETHQEILEQFLKYTKIENPLIESKKAKESCKDLFDSMPEAIKKSSCFSACPFGDYFTGISVDQVIASLRKPMSLSSHNDTQQPQPTTYNSKFSVEPGPCFNISPSKTTTTQTSKDAYERMKECEKMVSMLNDAKSRATTMPKYLQQHFERSIHEAEKNLEVAKKDYELLCKDLVASSDSTKADMPKEQHLYLIDIDKLYQNMKNCEKIYEKLKSTEPGFRASHGHNEGLMGHFRNRLKEAESNWRNAQIQYNECCAKDKLQKSLGALNSSTAYNEMKKQENLYANLMDAKNFNDGNCDEDKIEKTKLQLEKAKELYEEASRFGQAKSQLNSTFSIPSTLEASNSAAVKSGIEVKSGSQNLLKLTYDSDVSKMSKVNNQMSKYKFCNIYFQFR
uniref:Uncharacterized protein n=1 Tax=Panagrolaimus davidi TaxID=227884 RepID=A0A914QD45_9BILA